MQIIDLDAGTLRKIKGELIPELVNKEGVLLYNENECAAWIVQDDMVEDGVSLGPSEAKLRNATNIFQVGELPIGSPKYWRVKQDGTLARKTKAQRDAIDAAEVSAGEAKAELDLVEKKIQKHLRIAQRKLRKAAAKAARDAGDITQAQQDADDLKE